MFAVIRTGGKQYRVQKDDKLQVEKLEGKEGSNIDLSEVLFLNNGTESTLGEPLIKGATVTAKILEQVRAPKVTIFKKKRRQNYRRKRGHRQELTLIQITSIKAA
jgi:large subunit ribosomal protein L21